MKTSYETLTNTENVMNMITYKHGWKPNVIMKRGGVVLVYWEFSATDVKTGKQETWKSRKWYISPHMTNSEIVQTFFLAAKIAEIHEMHESFRYKGEILFNPHYDSDSIVESNIKEDVR